MNLTPLFYKTGVRVHFNPPMPAVKWTLNLVSDYRCRLARDSRQIGPNSRIASPDCKSCHSQQVFEKYACRRGIHFNLGLKEYATPVDRE